MIVKFLSIIIFFALSMSGMAQQIERRIEIQRNENGAIRSVEFSSTDRTVQIPKSADEFFRNMLQVQTADRFERRSQGTSREVFTHEHFVQYHNGIRVAGGGYNFHFRNGEMYFAHGNYVWIDNLNTTPTISREASKTAFADYSNIPIDMIDAFHSELLIKEIPLEHGVQAMLVYRIWMESDHPNNRNIGYIDAHSGKVVLTAPTTLGANTVGTFINTLYSGEQQANTWREPSGLQWHILEDRVRGINTRNLRNSTILSNAVDIRNLSTYWYSSLYDYDAMAFDVHWGLQQISDRFTYHGINLRDALGHPITAYIRYKPDFEDAKWCIIHRVMLFGQGGNRFYPTVTIDYVAHELGHGITQAKIGWDAYEDAVGLRFHEGMSDIWAMIMNYRIAPEQEPWRFGSGLFIGFPHWSIRDFSNPDDDNVLSTIACTFNAGVYNSGCCHIQGGVFSRWFYFVVNGGSGENLIGSNFDVHGVGMDIAEELIVNAVFIGKLQYTSTWHEIRENLLVAVRALHGYNSVEEKTVTNAWYAVGVGEQFICPPMLHFSNQQSITSDRIVVSCSNLNAQNITISNGATLTLRATGDIELENLSVTNNSRLIIDAGGSVGLGVGFHVELGSSFSMQ